MKPIEELLGKTIAEITVEELVAEIAERESVREVAENDRHPMSGPIGYALAKDINALTREICRIKLLPLIPEWPSDETLIAPGTLEAFKAGIEYGEKLAKHKTASKGHNGKRDSRLFAIKQAGKLTRNYSGIRYTDLRRQIAATLVTMDWYCPSDKKIKEWLNDAVKEGLLYLPEEMPKGRGPKK